MSSKKLSSGWTQAIAWHPIAKESRRHIYRFDPLGAEQTAETRLSAERPWAVETIRESVCGGLGEARERRVYVERTLQRAVALAYAIQLDRPEQRVVALRPATELEITLRDQFVGQLGWWEGMRISEAEGGPPAADTPPRLIPKVV